MPKMDWDVWFAQEDFEQWSDELRDESPRRFTLAWPLMIAGSLLVWALVIRAVVS